MAVLLDLRRQAALKRQQDQIGPPANAKLIQKIGHVEFHGPFGDVKLARDFLVGKILEERIEYFLLATAQIGDGVRLQAAPLVRQDGIDKSRKHRTRHPKPAVRNEWKSAGELVARFSVGQDAFNTEAKQRKAVGLVDGVSDDNQARVGEPLENVGQEGSGSLASRVRIDHIDLGARGFQAAQIGRECRFQLLGYDFELGCLRQQAFEFAQY